MDHPDATALEYLKNNAFSALKASNLARSDWNIARRKYQQMATKIAKEITDKLLPGVKIIVNFDGGSACSDWQPSAFVYELEEKSTNKLVLWQPTKDGTWLKVELIDGPEYFQDYDGSRQVEQVVNEFSGNDGPITWMAYMAGVQELKNVLGFEVTVSYTDSSRYLGVRKPDGTIVLQKGCKLRKDGRVLGPITTDDYD
jgi:hypothetical protein